MTKTLITGATRGLGREAARRLTDAGHTVLLSGRDEEEAADEAADIGAEPLRLDITDASSVARAVEVVQTRWGMLDVLVNNAGIAGDQRPPGEATIDDLVCVFDTNVIGAARVLRSFTPLLDASSPAIAGRPWLVRPGVSGCRSRKAPTSSSAWLRRPLTVRLAPSRACAALSPGDETLPPGNFATRGSACRCNDVLALRAEPGDR